MGRQTLAVLPREIEREWGPSVAKGYTPYVTTQADLRNVLMEPIKKQVDGQPPTKISAVDAIGEFIQQALR